MFWYTLCLRAGEETWEDPPSRTNESSYYLRVARITAMDEILSLATERCVPHQSIPSQPGSPSSTCPVITDRTVLQRARCESLSVEGAGGTPQDKGASRAWCTDLSPSRFPRAGCRACQQRGPPQPRAQTLQVAEFSETRGPRPVTDSPQPLCCGCVLQASHLPWNPTSSCILISRISWPVPQNAASHHTSNVSATHQAFSPERCSPASARLHPYPFLSCSPGG